MTLTKKALAYLDREPLQNINMTEPLRRGHGRVVYAGEDGVLMLETHGDFPMLSCADAEAALRITDGFEIKWDMAVQQEHSVAPMSEKYGFTKSEECYNSAYLGKEPLPLNIPEGVELRRLGPEYLDAVFSNYRNDYSSREYLAERIADGVVYGAFVRGELAGFIGEHAEGSGGMLEVLPQYRRLKLGTLLESYYLNETLARGHVPFGQFFSYNNASRSLQRSIGTGIAEKPMFWLMRGD